MRVNRAILCLGLCLSAFNVAGAQKLAPRGVTRSHALNTPQPKPSFSQRQADSDQHRPRAGWFVAGGALVGATAAEVALILTDDGDPFTGRSEDAVRLVAFGGAITGAVLGFALHRLLF